MDQAAEAAQLIEETINLERTTKDKQLCRVLSRITRRLKAEHKQLVKQTTKNKPTSNLPHLKGVLQTVKDSTGVQQVICDLKKYGIVIDVICDNGRTWKKVVARNAQSTHLIWAGKGQYGTKDVTKTVKKYLRSADTFCEFSPPRVVCMFYNGVTKEMAEYLEGLGAIVEGERVEIDADTTRRLQALEELDDSECEMSSSEEISSDDDLQADGHPSKECHDSWALEVKSLEKDGKVFLDVTSMVIYASDVCNGGATFNFKDKQMAEQAIQEQEMPVMPTLKQYMDNGRTLVTCETALDNFKEFMDALAGEEEKKRASELTRRLTVVPDLVSDKFLKLKTGGKIKAKARTIFGTADTLQCEILTSNEAFVRAAAAQQVNCAAILHQSRALSELTRLEETAVKDAAVTET